MAIQKRFIHFKKFSDFNSKKLSANEANTQYTVGVSGAIQNGEPDVNWQSYVWIKDTKQQWTHGQLYNGTEVNIPITYSELKTLKDTKNLIPGVKYRLTDYKCTTAQENTKSAGHVFDLILTALTENTLSEEASAALHAGDTYFKNNNLESWKVWYCLDNDTERFTWADKVSGKGVIYRLIDENGNDCPYDFKNIMFPYRTICVQKYLGEDSRCETYVDENGDEQRECFSPELCEFKYLGQGQPIGFWWDNVSSILWGEWNTREVVNQDPNPVCEKLIELGITDPLQYSKGEAYVDTIWHYTFNLYNGLKSSNTQPQDYSVVRGVNCYRNVIQFKRDLTYTGGKIALPYIMFNNTGRTQACYKNTIEAPQTNSENGSNTSIYFIIFGAGCHNNTLERGCYNIIAGDYCYDNTFGTAVNNIYLHSHCTSNSFGVHTFNVHLNQNCKGNTFAKYCNRDTSKIVFQQGCQYNYIGNNCKEIYFGTSCSHNYLEDSNYYITLQDNCDYNKFGIYYQGNSSYELAGISESNQTFNSGNFVFSKYYGDFDYGSKYTTTINDSLTYTYSSDDSSGSGYYANLQVAGSKLQYWSTNSGMSDGVTTLLKMYPGTVSLTVDGYCDWDDSYTEYSHNVSLTEKGFYYNNKEVAVKDDIKEFYERVTNPIPNNEIWYTTNNGKICAISCEHPDFVSHTQEGDKYIVRFSKPIVNLSGLCFWEDVDSTEDDGIECVYGCVDTIYFPNSLKKITERVLMCEYTSIDKVVLSNNITSLVDDWAGLPNDEPQGRIGVLEIGGTKVSYNLTYSNNTWLNRVDHVIIKEGTQKIGNYVFAESDIEMVTIPDSVTKIGLGAFYKATNLEHIQLGDSVKTIGNSAFNYTAISALELPATVTSLGSTFVRNCTKLKKITVNSIDVPTISANSFPNPNQNKYSIIVPDESLIAYKNATNWSLYSLYIHSINEEMTSITYEDLKALKDAGKLIPGHQYRIINYNTITTQPETTTEYNSFDVIVTALTSNTFSEEAKAAHSSNDLINHFGNSNLSAWQLWYCFDNDVNRFAWASTGGKGVIYRMVDEFGNDCPYDFKNIKFDKYLLCVTKFIRKSDNKVFKYFGTTLSNRNTDAKRLYCYVEENTMQNISNSTITNVSVEHRLFFNKPLEPKEYSDLYTVSIDDIQITAEYECSWSVGNGGNDWTIEDIRDYNELIELNEQSAISAYTFNLRTSGQVYGSYDYSLYKNDGKCFRNVIKCKYDETNGGKMYIPYVVFDNTSYGACYKNEIEAPITFKNNEKCRIVFGNHNHNNTLGRGCSNIFTGDSCFDNRFDTATNNIIMLDKCTTNTFGTHTSNITMLDECTGNTFDAYCDNKAFNTKTVLYKGCDFNKFGSYCYGLTLQESCSYNNFAGNNIKIVLNADSDYNWFAPYWRNHVVSGSKNHYINNDSNVKEMLYSELVTLRNNSQLRPGTWYRITDYRTTSTTYDTSISDRYFDVLVLATSVNTLSEEARACKSKRSSKFDNYDINFDAWKIWYCLDNDANRFAWADSTNGKGVIYRMIDEWNNDCPYDFKNIRLGGDYTFELKIVEWPEYSDYPEESYDDASIRQNEAHYIHTTSDSVANCTINNTICANIIGKIYHLPFNHMSGNCYNNYIGYNSTHNTIETWFNEYEDGYREYAAGLNNKIGDDCHENTVWGRDNILEGNCQNNSIFGERNTLKSRCRNNSLYESGQNVLGNSCSNIKLSYCYHNTFKSSCKNIELGLWCHGNKFEYGCYNIQLDSGSLENTFMQQCHNIAFYTSSDLSILKSCCCHNVFAPRCRIIGYNQYTSHQYRCLSNYYFNVDSTSPIALDTVNSTCELRVEKNSKGEIKIYSLADIIA